MTMHLSTAMAEIEREEITTKTVCSGYITAQYSTVPGAGTAGGRAAGCRPSASAGTPPPPAQSGRGYSHQTPGGVTFYYSPQWHKYR